MCPERGSPSFWETLGLSLESASVLIIKNKTTTKKALLVM